MTALSKVKPSIVWPGACVGILGGGQLGRFLAMTCRDWGYRVAVWSGGDLQAPALAVADVALAGDWDDPASLQQFCQVADVATFEVEHVPLSVAQAVADRLPLRPGVQALTIARHRQQEKAFLGQVGMTTAPWAPVDSVEDLTQAMSCLPAPWILKTAVSGYDGKGQLSLSTMEEGLTRYPQLAWRNQPAVLESRLSFRRELSLILARGVTGEIAEYGWIENHHERGILVHSSLPVTDLDPTYAQRALEQAHQLAQALDLVGLLTIEWFEREDGQLIVNEIAPRPHNSGHLTLEAAPTSQFEQQLRAIVGLPLGPTAWQVRQATMVNLMGEQWTQGEAAPDWSRWLTDPSAKLHLYGKTTARPGRKMGHVTTICR